MELPMSQHCCFDASGSLTALEQDSTIIAVIEISQSKWLVAALVPGVERQPLKRFDSNEEMLLKLLHRWHREAGQARHNISVSSSPLRRPRRVLACALAAGIGRRSLCHPSYEHRSVARAASRPRSRRELHRRARRAHRALECGAGEGQALAIPATFNPSAREHIVEPELQACPRL